jgi:hypothetical protein
MRCIVYSFEWFEHAIRLAGMAGHHRSCCNQQLSGHRSEVAPRVEN